jgi:hypothetical protein
LIVVEPYPLTHSRSGRKTPGRITAQDPRIRFKIEARHPGTIEGAP